MDLVWYKARSILLGIDYYTQSVTEAYSLAKSSNHPDAQWLCGIIEKYHTQYGKVFNTYHMFVLVEWDDPRSQLYAVILRRTYSTLKDSPFQLGRALYYINCGVGGEKLEHTGDPYVMYARGMWYLTKKDVPRALALIYDAAKLGCNEAILLYALRAIETPERFKWVGKIIFATNGNPNSVREFRNFINKSPVARVPGATEVWFIVGRIYNRMDKLNIKYDNDSDIDRWQTLYLRNCSVTADVVNAWLLCAHWLNGNLGKIIFNRDLRKMIGKLIWKGRKDGQY